MQQSVNESFLLNSIYILFQQLNETGLIVSATDYNHLQEIYIFYIQYHDGRGEKQNNGNI